ncbi:hypothetical protein Adt_15379 [Abeliophyllum distichum]|uniref:Uncharacterized protein n=1 Tax=Abeliophyllum distichum TaxID=126358 RepID=A0ABD1U2A1_9LAMI
MAEAESQIAILMKKLDDALNAQKIASEALEAANEENRQLRAEVLARQEEVSKLKSEFEECQKGKAEAEVHRDSMMAEKETLTRKLRDAEAEFVANFHHTEASTSFSNYFASVGHQEVLATLWNDI